MKKKYSIYKKWNQSRIIRTKVVQAGAEMVRFRDPLYHRDGGQGNSVNQSSMNVQSVVTLQGANTISATPDSRPEIGQLGSLDNENILCNLI